MIRGPNIEVIPGRAWREPGIRGATDSEVRWIPDLRAARIPE